MAIVGSRNFKNYSAFKSIIEPIIKRHDEIEIVSGGARGVDELAKRYAKLNKIPYTEFLADWDEHGKAAGPIRNKQIAEYCDEAIAIPYGVSKGTYNTISLFVKAGKVVRIIKGESISDY